MFVTALIIGLISVGVLWYIVTLPAVVDFWKHYRARIFWSLIVIITGLLLFRIMPLIASLLWALGAVILGGGARILQFLSFVSWIKRFRQQAAQQPSAEAAQGEMTAKEARTILNIPEHASEKEIHQAYIEAMKRNHPDKGGSDYFALKINQARDVLLGKK